MDKFSLVKGRHCLILNSKQEITRSENGGIFIMDKISGLVYDLPLLPEVVSFFDISVTDIGISEVKEVNDLNCNENENSLASCSNSDKDMLLNSDRGMWDDKAVKLLFNLYADHHNSFKTTSIKNNVIWDKIKTQMNIDGRYNFTKTHFTNKR